MAGVNIGSLEGLIRLKDEFTRPLNNVANQLQQTDARIQRMGDGFTRFGSKLSGALTGLVAVGAVGVAFKAIYDNVAQAETAMAQLEAGVMSTGGAAGRSAEQLAEMAGELQRLSGVEDEVIMGAQSVLLTFTKIGRDTFPQATQAALDLSRKFGSDLSSAAMQVGKALNDPIKGVTALSKAGVQFTESQKDTIKALVETGKMAEAQAVILRELEIQVGGAAAAFRDTLPGAIEALKNSWGDLLEEVGSSAEGGGMFRTGIEGLVSGLDYLKDNWYALEAAVFMVLGRMSGAVAEFVEFAARQWLRFAEITKTIQDLTPNFLPLADVHQKRAEDQLRRATEFNAKVKNLAEDLRVGFEEKANAAIEAGIAPVKGLDSSLKGLGRTTGETSDEAKKLADQAKRMAEEARKLAKELAALEAGLKRSTGQNRQLTQALSVGASREQIVAIERAHKLENSYLQDVEKFGKKAADSLQLLRAADLDSAVAAEKAKASYEKLADALAELSKNAAAGFKEQVSREIEAGLVAIDAQVDKWAQALRQRRDLFNDVEFEMRISAIDEATPRLRQIEEQYLTFIRNLGQGSLTEGERVFKEMAARFGWTIDQIKAALGTIADAQLADQVRGSAQDSPLAVYRRERAEIERLMRASDERVRVSAEDGTAAISNLTVEFWDKQLGAWAGALDMLAERFGGLFSYLQQAISVAQQAVQAYGSFSSLTSSLGGGASMAAAFGAVGAFLVFAVAIYDEFQKHVSHRQARKYELGAVLTMNDGEWDTPGLQGKAREASLAIAGAADALAEALGGTIETFAEIEIQVRRDGKYFQARVNGEWLERFQSMEEAIDAAMLAALRSSDTTFKGLSELVAQGLEQIRSVVTEESLGDVTGWLGQLREITELNWTDGQRALLDGVRGLQELWEALERVTQVTPAVTQGFDNLLVAEQRMWQTWLDSITGRERSNAEILADKRQELALYKIELDLRKAAIAQRLLLIQAEIAAIRAGNALVGGGGGSPGGGGGSGGRVGGGGGGGSPGHGIAGVAAAFAMAGSVITYTAAAVAGATGVLSQAALDMIAALEAEADALARLLANLPEPPDPSTIRLPGAGGSGTSDRDSVRDFIDQRTWEMSLRGVSDYRRGLAELQRQYEDLLEQAGRDNVLRTRLIALREREIELMRQEQIRDVVDAFQDFLGLIDPFEQAQQRAADLTAEILDTFGMSDRAARMMGRVAAELDRQLQQMSDQMAAGLLGSLIGDMERFGASEQQMTAARNQMALLEHHMKLAQYRAEFEILRAQGRLAPAVLASIEGAITFLEGVDPLKFVDAIVQQLSRADYEDAVRRDREMVNGAGAAGELAEELKRAKDLLAKYQEDGLDPFTRTLRKIGADFKTIRAALGDTAEVMAAYNGAVRDALADFLEPIKNLQRDLFMGDLSPADTMAKWAESQAEFADVQARFRAGDLSVVKDIPGIVQELLGLAREIEPIGSESYKAIFASANRFLNEVLSLTPETAAAMGSAANPMAVAGMSDLAAIGEAQLDKLERIHASSDRVADAVEALNTKINSGSRLATDPALRTA